MITFKEHIVKVSGGYRLVSKKSGKNLGTYPSKEGAEKRERQVQYFKHLGEDVPTNSTAGGVIASIGVNNPNLPNQAEPGKKKKDTFSTFVKRKT